jgi:SAM-dependent methyltransferase
MGELPARCDRVLDVGCGTGGLASLLAARVSHVDAVDRDPAVLDVARARVPANVHCRLVDVLRDDLGLAAYDAVLSVSALHHLPLEQGLAAMAPVLRPGGVLAAVALPRVDLPRELPLEAAALVADRVVGLTRAARGRRTIDDAVAVRMRDPELTVREVRDRATAVLPGVRVRRLLFWRYALTWQASR